MKKLTLAYFGSSYFSAVFLEKLIKDNSLPIEIKLVITQPDKPAGRKQALTPTPVKILAKKYHISCFDELQTTSSELQITDLSLLYAYGKIIPPNILALPKYGFWNIHPSLLPKYRGSSPIAYPLILSDQVTGVSLIKMTDQVDAGPIIAQEKIDIGLKDKRPDLETKLTDLAFSVLKKTLNSLSSQNPPNSLNLKPQNNSLATNTKFMNKQHGYLPLKILIKAMKNELLTEDEVPEIIKSYNSQTTSYTLQAPNIVFNLFRGLYPWPGIWTIIKVKSQEKRLKIIDLDLIDEQLILKKVQLEGKKEVDFKTFDKAYKIFQ